MRSEKKKATKFKIKIIIFLKKFKYHFPFSFCPPLSFSLSDLDHRRDLSLSVIFSSKVLSGLDRWLRQKKAKSRTMSLSDSDSSSYGGDYKNFKQISRDRNVPYLSLSLAVALCHLQFVNLLSATSYAFFFLLLQYRCCLGLRSVWVFGNLIMEVLGVDFFCFSFFGLTHRSCDGFNFLSHFSNAGVFSFYLMLFMTTMLQVIRQQSEQIPFWLG